MRRTPRSLAVVAFAAALAVTACSGDDDAATADEPSEEPSAEPGDEPGDEPSESASEEPAADADLEPAEEPADEPSDDSTGDAAEDATGDDDSSDDSSDDTIPEPAEDGDRTLVSGVDELPDECVDRVAEMLREIEPAVSEVDWSTATLDDLDATMLEVEDEFEALDDDELASGCSEYEFEDDAASFQAMIDIAEAEAPGVVGWLTFVQTVFSSMPGGDGAAPVDGPTDCEGAIAYLDELVAGGGTMSSLPVAELAVVSQAFAVVTEDCALEVMNEFMERPEVTAFLS